MQSSRNGCGFSMLAKLGQLDCAEGFVHLMYTFLEMLDKIMEFMLPSGNEVYGNGLGLLPVRSLNSLMRVRGYRRSGASWNLSRTGRTRQLNPARYSSPWGQFSE